jgi:purine-binding chemotaxis protein CheW
MEIKNDMKNDSNELLQLVTFKIGNEEFGINILLVQEIIKMLQITKIPNTPEYVEGIINLRGKIIPVVDLRSRLGMNKKDMNKDSRVIVVEVDNKTIGFIVDSVNEVIRIPANITEPPPELITGVDSEYIKSVGKLEDRLLILIDIEKILKSEEKTALEKIII